MNRRKAVTLLSTVMWAMAGVCVAVAFFYSMYFWATAEDALAFNKARVFALVVGFLPCVFTFAATRVMYGIETYLGE